MQIDLLESNDHRVSTQPFVVTHQSLLVLFSRIHHQDVQSYGIYLLLIGRFHQIPVDLHTALSRSFLLPHTALILLWPTNGLCNIKKSHSITGCVGRTIRRLHLIVTRRPDRLSPCQPDQAFYSNSHPRSKWSPCNVYGLHHRYESCLIQSFLGKYNTHTKHTN